VFHPRSAVAAADPQWSPDGSKLAFVSDRGNHSFIAVYDVAGKTLSYLDPTVDRDGEPAWSPDGKQIAFLSNRGRDRFDPAADLFVMSADGSATPDDVLLFNLPGVRVFLITSAAGRDRLSAPLAARPWVTAIVAGSLAEQFAALRDAGIHRACSVGGRRSATALVDANLVNDVYLTTTQAAGGTPATPWYIGRRRLAMTTVLVKAWDGEHGAVRFEHGVL